MFAIPELVSSVNAVRVDLEFRRTQECGILKWIMKVWADTPWESCALSLIEMMRKGLRMVGDGKIGAMATPAHGGPL